MMNHPNLKDLVSTLSDKELTEILCLATLEANNREREMERKRKEWVMNMFYRFLGDSHATEKRIGDTTVVAIYSRRCGLRMATAVPVKGDTYDERTGVAVAFAKAIGESIPDFI